MKLGLLQAADKQDITHYMYPPTGLGYIASYLRKNLDLDDIIIEYDIRRILQFKPDLVGISSTTNTFNIAIRLAERLKAELGIPVIVGGVHISSLPLSLPGCFDIGVIGEGEKTMAELVHVFETKGFNHRSLSNVKGIVYHSRGEKIITDPQPLFINIDEIPFPDRPRLESCNSAFKDYVNMVASRGCPYNCSFCYSRHFWKRYRMHSAEYVVSEILDIINKYKAKQIHIFDDLFIADGERLKQIVELVIKYKINRKVTFRCSVRPNLINEETCQLLKRMNVLTVDVGIESNSDRVLRYLRKTEVNANTNQRCIDLCYKYGIEVAATFIIGTPVETEEDLLETYHFIEKNKNKFATILPIPLVPYPGTEIWKQAFEKGLVTESMDWDKFKVNHPKFFDPERYIYLNENMNMRQFYKHYIRFLILYFEILHQHSLRKQKIQLLDKLFSQTKH